MAIAYYPYPNPNFSPKFYQQGTYPPWMAQPAYSSRGWSGSRQWRVQPAVSDGGLSEFGLYGLNYGQPKLIQTAPTISPTCYPAPIPTYPPITSPMSMMTSLSAENIGQPMIMSRSFCPAAFPMSYGQPQWFQPASMSRYY